MAINYIEKGIWLHNAVNDAGHSLVQVDGTWVSSDDIAVQAIIDSFNPLPDEKAIKITELKAEALSRMQAVFPALSDFDDVAFQREFYLSIAPAARQPTANFQQIIDIYQTGLDARDAINALTTVAEVQAYDVIVTPAWP